LKNVRCHLSPENFMTNRRLILWGATGQAKVLRECVAGSELELAAVFDNNESSVTPFVDVPLYYGWDGFLEWLAMQPQEPTIQFLVAVGGDRGKDRVELQRRLQQSGLLPATAIHRSAFVAPNARIGPGSQILAHATVCVDANLGEGCIVNTAASVDHECHLAEGVHIAPGARLTGLVQVGQHSMIGAGAIVLPRIRIGENSVIGAGTVVVRDVPDNVLVAGNPGRVIRKRAPQ
jgi:sugar O-acyltransferase (sialic acid O-acetyltransferase NeuD family)